MEPWLDSLSEDWESEPRLSSPNASILRNDRPTTAQGSVKSSSRIPHLSQSIRTDSGSFLKPRSSRGIAKANGQAILVERSASSLNVAASPRDSLKKSRTSSLPRRASSNFSESQSSVQHHSVSRNNDSQDTPEWKRRLIKGEDAASDGVDLFSPSKLEGMFTEPETRTDRGKQGPTAETQPKPWGSLRLGQFSSTTEQFQSLRASRNRLPPMSALREVDEDEDNNDGEAQLLELEPEFSAISSDLAQEGSLRGLVRRRVSHLEQPKHANDFADENSRAVSVASQDPRWRTFSGQQEIKNEVISPITASATNTIRETAVKRSVEFAPELLREKLQFIERGRPSSSSSDRDISYVDRGTREVNHDREFCPEMTSHSLPEDLSMGTQELISSRRSAPGHRPIPSTLHLVQDQSVVIPSDQLPSQIMPSSPPTASVSHYDNINSSNLSDLLPELLEDTSVVRHSPSPTRPSSNGSPLKLFGNRDTYTSNKLMRVLSHYGQDASTRDNSSLQDQDSHEEEANAGNDLRMSQFGAGELDAFNFEKEVARPKTMSRLKARPTDRIFHDVEGSTAVDRHKQRSRSGNRLTSAEEHQKRLPSSPAKDRTPKRRRTLLKDEIFVEGVGVEIKLDQVPDPSSGVAGKKRKDARPGEHGEQADPNVLAARTILRPKAGSRKSSATSQPRSTERDQNPPMVLAEALAAELETFVKGASDAHQDSRKPSLATKDYMEEANKVMEFIRARGKPKAKLSDVHEPPELSELNSDDILDLEIDDDSTKESFSRPPSRDRPSRPRENPRIAVHDAQTATQLKKYQETDDLELLASTSAIGTLNIIDNQAASEAACIPIPEEVQESSPPNIRLAGPIDDIADGLRSLCISDTTHKQQNSLNSSDHTIQTGSSGSSGRKGMITHGTVSIPDKVGTMTFDYDKQMWIKQKVVSNLSATQPLDRTPRSAKETTFEEDPFQDIPDLSIDDQRESPQYENYIQTSESVQENNEVQQGADETDDDRGQHNSTDSDRDSVVAVNNSDQVDLDNAGAHSEPDKLDPEMNTKSQASKHEERLHKGLPSVEPSALQKTGKQARVVTIALTSSRTSPARYDKHLAPSGDDLDNDDDFLPPEDLIYEDYVPMPKPTKQKQKLTAGGAARSTQNTKSYQNLIRPSTLIRNPMPVIKEDDQSVNNENEGMSLVRMQSSLQSTPRADNDHALIHPTSNYKGSSILCLTPLSEFTMHQADAANPGDESFIVARPHPRALLQAHGTLALSKDELVKAITDATPEEPFWENLKRLELEDKRLTSLNALQEYCPTLERLFIAKNSVSQLSGLPHTLRQLDISMNCLNDFTSWAHLTNLQRIDVSSNKLESLKCFESLYHLRELKASNNRIRDIDGVSSLNGLITLDLSHNEICHIDFEDADLMSLESLDLSNNQVAVMRNIHYLPQLGQLMLARNSLRDLDVPEPAERLRILSLAHNELENIDLTNLPGLQSLDLDSNLIRSIVGLCHAYNLRELLAREQRHSFDFVNTILATPNECSKILLSSNILSEGSIVLPSYPHYNLRHLELAGCGLRNIPQGFGDFFPNCRKLNLNFNAVSELSPLLGCVSLRELMLAGNRIQRLRRSCLVLSRLPALESLDMRENPLTVGFYPPINTRNVESEPFVIPSRLARKDDQWLLILDETTALKRRMLELMLADGCQSLRELDGSGFSGREVLGQDVSWARLASKGIIKKPDIIEAESPDVEKKPDRVISGHMSVGTSGDNMGTRTGEQLTHERSLVIE